MKKTTKKKPKLTRRERADLDLKNIAECIRDAYPGFELYGAGDIARMYRHLRALLRIARFYRRELMDLEPRPLKPRRPLKRRPARPSRGAP